MRTELEGSDWQAAVLNLRSSAKPTNCWTPNPTSEGGLSSSGFLHVLHCKTHLKYLEGAYRLQAFPKPKTQQQKVLGMESTMSGHFKIESFRRNDGENGHQQTYGPYMSWIQTRNIWKNEGSLCHCDSVPILHWCQPLVPDLLKWMGRSKSHYNPSYLCCFN